MNLQTHKVLILTVGQTIEPLEFSLTEHAPLGGVVFVASQWSYPVAGELLKRYGDQFRHHTLLLDDHEDLGEAYRKGMEALQKALEWDGRPVLVDISGGTKTMVAGLVLALSGKGITFSYVGGTKRDAQGRVVSGSERMRLLEDPTYRYGLREWEGFRRAWNGADFRAARDFLSELLARPLTPSEQRFYTHLKGVSEAMLDWDLFHHKAAWQKLEAHLEPALTIAEAWGHGAKVRVLEGLKDAKTRLRAILDKENKPTFALLADLLANAERRAARGRYDDALARLYRAIEMAVEADILERTGVLLYDETTFVGEYEKHRPWAKRYREAVGLREALNVAMGFDGALGCSNTLAQRLYAEYTNNGKLGNFVRQRNQSILAHGHQPVSVTHYTEFRDYLVGLGLRPAPAWPSW
ncbi:CRISPR-associated protein [Meiothermus luteus]|uniref:CRISPR-associated protein n=1 Tax=Meiothermus luteus TaxID=2026184 RepID=A0A399EUA3_9DEIN|nr:TIGR02710 family CRISPR-associated CARF protein [Meiothermus luteus]RIH87598.1 CRISPR-associated protein [Meiothermus luteus]RMH57997.1 MAG: TIGR02710 family CRISPR-associated protein [Deinococcota bacterium]